MFCWFPACIASLSCSFLIYTFLTFDQKKKEQREGACSPALASCVLLRSRESVPFAGVCTVLLVSSLYRKLVLLFLIYILLTFDKKKKKEQRESKVF
jgi:cbb3-type cytochrome oxidase subunit 3